ncbi:LysR family transcriptional regulator [Vogesella sp. LIG4]|uniref:LysR family transcriptional regulator n=1 Tax=Vogesella sp. LIG4 TaxID=1192162 RepID=UPI000820201A|nr:LysR family transcriptional regulator [Vogesella sp. LIG4]SCK30422.1 DNA-binding transcriptional regulator, LysR family [Vogesella sp. LIG4]
MEIYQLRTFVTVAQLGHLTQAAEVLHLSQPAVTAQIKAVEEEVGMPLFERTAGGVVLTRAGQELLPQAQEILASAKNLLNHARSLKGQLTGKAQIGITLMPAVLRIGPWVARLTERFPLLEVCLQQGVTGDVINAVRKKELDGGFYLGKNPYVNVHTVLLDNMRMRVVLPKGWLARVPDGNPRELGKLCWVGVSQFSSLSKIVSELWRELNISPKKVSESDTFLTAMELVKSGVGVALLPEADALAAEQAGELEVWPELVKTAELQFVFAADKASDPVLQVLIGELAPVWGIAIPNFE